MYLYHRFALSYHDVEKLLAYRSVYVSYEAIRLWFREFGRDHAKKLCRGTLQPGDTWYLDEIRLAIGEKAHWL